MGAFKDLTGEKYGRLTIVSINPKTIVKSNGAIIRFWNCLCECGKEIVAVSGNLKNGHTQSCGCLRIETIVSESYKHGASGSSEFRTWCGMRQRCYDKNQPAYPDYGGRGITVCQRWMDSFENFMEDMGLRSSGMTLERKDNSGNYEKSNCVWATRKVQNNNKRSNVFIEHEGKRQTLSQWSSETGIPYCTLRMRIVRGWNPITAITTMVRTPNTL